jgi:hypothetical protein
MAPTGERTDPRFRVKCGLTLGPGSRFIGVALRFPFGLGVASYVYRAIREARAVDDGLSVGSCFIDDMRWGGGILEMISS